jgi:hypothetical protein
VKVFLEDLQQCFPSFTATEAESLFRIFSRNGEHKEEKIVKRK